MTTDCIAISGEFDTKINLGKLQLSHLGLVIDIEKQFTLEINLLKQ